MAVKLGFEARSIQDLQVFTDKEVAVAISFFCCSFSGIMDQPWWLQVSQGTHLIFHTGWLL
jgi:hypothetical protein